MQTETLTFDTAKAPTTAHVVLPDSPNGKAVILIHEWWGLNAHIKDIAGRYADEGFIAIAPDLLSGSAPNGGGTGDKVAALSGTGAATDTAGLGAFGGLISTTWQWVWFSTWVTLVCGVILGIVSAKITAAITPKPKAPAPEAA